MRIQSTHRIILKRLESKPRALFELTHSNTDNHSVSYHYAKFLHDLAQHGYVIEHEDKWHLTQFGRMELSKALSKAQAHDLKIKIQPYDGAELRPLANRPGCYDFLKHPSRFSETRVYPKGVTQ